MDGMRFSGYSSLSQLLKIRPAAVERLEASDPLFWNRLDISVDAFCREAGLDPTALVSQVLEMPVLKPEGGVEPLFRIVDFLTAEHRGFRERDLPAIHELQGNHAFTDGHSSNATPLFRSFEEGFLEHLHEEEERIFPYILRLEACMRIPELKPLINRVSFSLLAARQGHAIREKRLQLRSHSIQNGTMEAGDQFHAAMDDFENRLTRHTCIETDTLLPRAMEIEKRLMEWWQPSPVR